MTTKNQSFKPQELARYGVHYSEGTPRIATPRDKMIIAQDTAMLTTPNAGVLQMFTQFIDPEVTRILFSPNSLTEALQEVQKGDWTTSVMTFPVVENGGKPVTYGDWNDNGTTSANVNYHNRQSYNYQQFLRVGEKEAAIYGEAKLSWAAELELGIVESLNKMQHEIYAFGVAGLQNYGVLNDPNLLPAIPIADAWKFELPLKIVADIQKMFKQLAKQANGLVKRTDDLILLMSPEQEALITAANDYGLNVADYLKKSFPNLSIYSVPEYSTASGQVVQLVLRKYQGSDTIQLAYAEKMRVHPMIQKASGWIQKRCQTTYGAIIRRPMFVVTATVPNETP